MKKIVVLTGAGISQESGIQTFRDSNGLWNNYKVDDVATYMGWLRDKKMVLEFYNQRRAELEKCEPNGAHLGLVELEKNFEVYNITQNVDNLFERSGSNNILHLHGELTKAQSAGDDSYVIDIGYNRIELGDLCPKGYQMRPFIVWFGEDVPNLSKAIKLTKEADIFVVIGTSLEVYPAASLIEYIKHNTEVYMIDPNIIKSPYRRNINYIKNKAVAGVQELIKELNEK